MSNLNTLSETEMQAIHGGQQCFPIGSYTYCYTVNYCYTTPTGSQCFNETFCNTVDLGEYCVDV